MSLAEKAAERRKRLRAKVETRRGPGRIEASPLSEDRVNESYLRIGKVVVKTKRPALTNRGVTIARTPVRASIASVRAREESTRTPPRRRTRTP